MVEVLVEYDYNAKEPDELTIRRGDIVKDVTMKSGGWWEGVLNENKGMFPDNFVKVLNKDASSVVFRNRKDSARIRQCRVVFSYKQDHEDELNLNVGDLIDIVGEEEEGWWRGVLNGKEGVFPSNFVEEITPVVSKPRPSSRDDITNNSVEHIVKVPSLPAKQSKILCEVKYPYKAENSDELNLKEGDIITLISTDGEDIGWWKGESNGEVGVFPDNFVTVLPPTDDKLPKEDKKSNRSSSEPISTKPTSTASQRKSLENKTDKPDQDKLTKVTPPIPGKKPVLAIKKSPSGTGFISGIKKKIAEMSDAVDGSSASKSSPTQKSDITDDQPQLVDFAFDQVERRPLLSDVRATRPKGPGRRPPSVVYKEGEPVVPNGTSDHVNLDILAEQISNSSIDGDLSEVKPKLREWEKHKAPWLEEMKKNQAKRTSTSPGPEHRLKLTPTDKGSSDAEESKSTKTSPYEKEGSPVDMAKSMPSLSNKLKTPPELEKAHIRVKPKLPVPARPQTVANTSGNHEVQSQRLSLQGSVTSSLQVITNRSPSPMHKPVIIDKPVELKPVDTKLSVPQQEPVTQKQFNELLERIEKLEALVEKQNEVYTTKLEELGGKLQIESDLRMMLQTQLEKLSQCVTQV